MDARKAVPEATTPLTEAGSSGRDSAHQASLWRFLLMVRWLALGVIVLSLFAIGRKLPVALALQALEGWIERLGIWGPVVFGLIYVVAVLLLIPASALTLAAGAIFGLVVATITVSMAATLAVALAFLISRYVARDWIAEKVKRYPKFAAIDRAVSEGGWKIVAMLRLSPAVPFTLQNYLYGLTGIRFGTCVLTSWVAMLPGTLLYVYLGHVGRAGLEATAGGRGSRNLAEWALLIVGLIATFAVTVYVSWLGRKALKSAIRDDQPARTRPLMDAEAEVQEVPGWTWGTILLVVIAVAAAAAAIFVHINPTYLKDLVPPLPNIEKQAAVS